MPPHTVTELLHILQQHHGVLGLIEFGSDHRNDGYAIGDYDLFVVLTAYFSTVRSLHFSVGSTPVDLNFITQTDLDQLTARDYFRWAALRDGRVVYDPEGVTAPALHRLQHSHAPISAHRLSETTIARTRHWHRHTLDKVHGRLETHPVACRFVLHTNMARLVVNYFHVRHQSFDGDIRALAYLEQHEPSLFAKLTAFYATADLHQQVALTREISAEILAPIGGIWQDNEIIAFGMEESSNMQAEGEQVFRTLFGT